MNEVIEEFRHAIIEAGLEEPPEIIPDTARPQRYGNKLQFWYLLHTDFPPSGSFGIWDGHNPKWKWTAKQSRQLTNEEKDTLNKRIEADRQRKHREEEQIKLEAKQKAQEIWAKASQINEHEYLTRKRIKAHVAREYKGALVVPVINKEIVGLQFIDGQGVKRFLTGTPKRGAYTSIGGKPADRLVICEGYATGASIYEATGIPVVIAFDSGNLPVVAVSMREKFPDIKILIACDDDRQTRGNPGLTKGTEASTSCVGELRRPIFPAGDWGHPTDFNDLACLVGMDEVRKQIEDGKPTYEIVPTHPDNGRPITQEASLFDPFPDMGPGRPPKPLGTIDNLRELLIRMGVTVRYNVIHKSQEILIPNETYSIDNRNNASLARIMSWAVLARMPTAQLGDFLGYIADQNQYNPVATWINSKPWDGKSRLNDFFATVKAVGESDNSKTKLMKETLLLRWLVSAVAAAFRPEGVSAHGVLVFQGDQYLGKTAWFKRLVPSYLDVIADGMILRPDDRDSVKQIISKWLVELGELDATFKRSDIAQLKAFITRDKDIMRLSYDKRDSEFARRTVFFASVNPKQFLHDPTGNRRYWTIECESILYNHDLDMQQIWAEIYDLYKNGESWYLSAEEMPLLNSHNKDFEVSDPIEELIRERLDWEQDKKFWSEATVSQLLEQLGISKPTQTELNKAGSILKKITGVEPRRTGQARLYKLPYIKQKTTIPIRQLT